MALVNFQGVKSIKTYDELREKVEANQGVLTIAMRSLRDINGADRLGVHVRSNIGRELAGRGLGHYPKELPDSQDAYARVFKLGSPVAEIINAVLLVRPEKDALIRKAASSDNSKVLDRIRELLDEGA
jgi:hypothetical protein